MHPLLPIGFRRLGRLAVLCCLLLSVWHAPAARADSDDSEGAASPTPALGVFQNDGDVGTVLHPGSAHFDAAHGTYTVTGSGENMWFGEDDFHYVWTKVSGDVALTADIAFVGDRGNPHRKAVLMIRQSLDGGSKAVDIAQHGNGLTSLQFRATDGGPSHEIRSNIAAPQTVRIEKRGDLFYAFISGSDGKLHPTGASTKLALTGPFYIGIGVSAHDKDATETALFSHVKLTPLSPTTGKPVLYSTLETVTIASTDRRVAYIAPGDLESPAWARDGKTIAFTARHDDATDGYTIPVSSGPVTPQKMPSEAVRKFPAVISTAKSEISPDGQYIYFSTERSGHAQIWRSDPNGNAVERFLVSDTNDWFPHVSPDGKWLVFLSYPPTVAGHPANQDAVLNLMSLEDRRVHVLAILLGGEGTINLPSWSPDSSQLAFISYELLAPGDCTQ
jgi:TolB protein